MKRYRGFLFDVDNTLLDYDRAEAEALDETMADAAPSVPLEKARSVYRAINTGYWKRFEQAEISREELKVGRFADLLAAVGVAGDAKAIGESYLLRLSRRAYFLPHAREVIESLSRTAALCLVTNGFSIVQRGRLSAAGIEGFFSAILISEEMGFAKPDPRFFQAACAALDLPPADLLCVGDSPVTDVGGALSAGIDACWYAPDGREWPGAANHPTLVIGDLRDLVPLAGTASLGE
jgi:YjjG family noncanonical pyrimidine nucleotidase